MSYRPVVLWSLRPEGFEPPPCELKARCAAVTPRPRMGVVCVSVAVVLPSRHLSLIESCCSPRTCRSDVHLLSDMPRHKAADAAVAREGVEPSFPPYQSGVLDRWTTGLCVNLCSRDGRTRTDDSVLPRHVGCRSPTSREVFSDPCGIRTQPLRLERPATSPEVERAMLCAHRVRRVGQEALESSSAELQSAAIPSQLPTHDREDIAANSFVPIAES